MSESEFIPDTETSIDDDTDDPESTIAELEAELARLRQEYDAARRTQYQRTAIGLGLIGIAALAGGVVITPVREVLIVLGITGLFGAVITYYITPETFVAADIGERVSADLAENLGEIVVELGLTTNRLYVPTETTPPVRLFIPRVDPYSIPDADALRETFVITSENNTHGIALTPTGNRLFDSFEQTRNGPLADDPAALSDQLATGLTDGLELAATVETEQTTDQTMTVRIIETQFGTASRFDNPATSFFAVGFATALNTTVEVEYHDTEEPQTIRATFAWDV
jgi:hypothetical protein